MERTVLITQAADATARVLWGEGAAPFNEATGYLVRHDSDAVARAVLDVVEALIREDERTHIQARIEALRDYTPQVPHRMSATAVGRREPIRGAVSRAEALRVVGEATPDVRTSIDSPAPGSEAG